MARIKKQFKFLSSIKSIMIVVFVMGSFVVFADSASATNWKPNPNQCPTTYNGQIGNPGEVMCGLNSGVAHWYDMTTLVGLVPAVSTTVNTGGGTYGGYVVDCDAFDSTVPRCDNTGSFWCSPDATCNSAYRNTECAPNKWATESDSFVCDDCQTGRWDCDSNNTCEIANGASCTANLGGNNVPGTYNCTAGGTCSDLGGNTATCTCVPGIQYFQTGVQAQFATTSPLLWGTQYGSGDLVRISNNDLSTTTFMVSNSGQVGIGLTSVANQYVALDVSSTERGVLLPRLTTAQRNAILTPPESLLVYNIDNHQFEYYATSSWLAMGAGGGGPTPETDPIWSAVSTSLTVSHFATNTVSQWTNDAGYITSYTTTSPAGANGEIQFYTDGAFNATNTLVWDNALGTLSVGNNYTFLSGSRSFVQGLYSQATGTNSIAMGQYAQATNNFAVAIGGSSPVASGYSSLAMGSGAHAYSNNSIALGNQASAENLNSVAIGYQTRSAGNYAVAIGNNAVATGLFSVAVGAISTSSGNSSFVGGYNNNSSGNYSAVFGSNNINTGGDYAFISGDHNVNSNASYSAIFGAYSTSTGQYSFIGGGLNTVASGLNSIAFGRNLTVSGNYSFGVNVHDSNSYTVSQPNTIALMGGNVGVGTTTPASVFSVVGTGLGNGMVMSSGSYMMAGIGNHGTIANAGALATFYQGTMKTLIAASGTSYIGGGDFRVGSGYQFRVDIGGDLYMINGATYSWPTSYSGSTTTILQNDGSGNLTWVTTSSLGLGGGGTPAGSDGEIQFNDSGAFGATPTLYWNKTNERLGIGTSSPLSKLHVNDGGLLITGDTGDTPISGWGTRLMWVPSKASFRAGYVNGTEWDDANIGWASFAGGDRNIASGDYSAVFGGYNTASGDYSFASGDDNTASNYGATAFGVSNIASGFAATVFGANNTASGTASVAFGQANNATNQHSIAFGYQNTASGEKAIVFGANNTASGYNSTAFGRGMTVSGQYSVGINVHSSNNYTLSQANTIALMGGNVGVGTTTPLFKLTVDGGLYASGTFGAGETLTYAGAGTRMIWYPKKAAFRAGYVGGTQWDDANIGEYSVAMGNGVRASGYGDIAIGTGVTASGGNSATAIGALNTASGNGAIALGRLMTVSGDYSFGVNVSTTGATLSQANTIALMGGNVGVGTTSPLFKLTVDGGIYSTGTFGAGETLTYAGAGTRMIWYPRKAAFRAGYVDSAQWNEANIGTYSTAFGEGTEASGDHGSTAFGNGSIASGNYGSTAFGSWTEASGQSSAAFNIATIASGNYSTAFGNTTRASGMTATAFGESTTASGYISTVFGRGMTVSGDYSFGINVGSSGSYTVSQPSTIALMGGNVGIGTTSPQYRLTVAGDFAVTGTIRVGNNMASGTYGQLLMSTGTGAIWMNTSSLGLDAGNLSGSGTSTQVAFFTGTNTLSSSSSLYWNNTNGRLGINNSNPEFALTIGNDGGIIATGTYGSGTILTTAGAGTRMIWYPYGAAFRAGIIDGTQWDETNIGHGSVAFGANSIASGAGSMAVGAETIASNASSFASGYGAVASGYVGSSIGYYTTSSGHYGSFSIGERTVASGNRAFAGGYYSIASGTAALAFGQNANALGNNSVVLGQNVTTTLSSSNNFAFGNNIIVSGNYSFGVNVSSTVATLAQANTIALMGGNVGIGTTSPPLKLTIDASVASGGSEGIGIFGGNSTTVALGNFNSGGTYTGVLALYRSDYWGPTTVFTAGGSASLYGFHIGTSTVPTTLSRFTVGSSLQFRISSDGDITRINNVAMSWPASQGDPGTILQNDGSGNLSWATTSTLFASAGGWTDDGTVVRLTTITDNVGIGTTTPLSKLHINDGGLLVTGTTGATPISGPGTRLMWIPAKSAFRAGYVDGTQWNDANIGDWSFAGGYNNIANGNLATAFGYNNVVSGGYATAFGAVNTSSADYATAFGWGNIAGGGVSTVFGRNNIASGDVSTAFGYSMTVSGDYSFGVNVSSTVPVTLSQNNTIAFMGGDVGIGTTTPTSKLHVLSASGGDGILLSGTDDNKIAAKLHHTYGSGATAGKLSIYSNNIETVSILADGVSYFNGGRVGINTAYPSTTLHVYGTTTAQTIVPYMVGSPNNVSLYNLGASTSRWNELWAGTVNIGTSTWSLKTTGADRFGIFSGPSGTATETISILQDSGNVGIGVTAPSEKLQVSGNIRIPNTSATVGSILMFTNRYIHSYGGSTNFFAGNLAGNYTLTGSAQNNTGVGNNVLSSLSSGDHNTALGYDASSGNTTGRYNVAVGSQALQINSAGGHANVAVGYNALQFSNSPSSTGIGYRALQGSSGYYGTKNVAVGYEAMQEINIGSSNTAVGYQALMFIEDGYSNVAIGTNALDSLSDGYRNVAVGENALGRITTGQDNVAVGHNAGYQATGLFGTIIGPSTGGNLTSGNYSTFVGYLAGDTVDSTDITGRDNTAIGHFARLSNGSVAYGTAVGYDTEVSSSYATALGTSASATGLRSTAIGYDASATGQDDIVIGDSNADIYYVAEAADDYFLCISTAGYIQSFGAACTPSDVRLKKDVTSISASLDVLNVLDKLSGVYFYWDTSVPGREGSTTSRQIGMLAQNVQEFLPELIEQRDDGYLGLNYSQYVGFLTEVAKAQQNILDPITDAIRINTSTHDLTFGTLTSSYNLTTYGDLSFILPSDSTSTHKLSFSNTATFESSVSSTPDSRAFIFNALNFNTSTSDNYILSLRSNNNPVFSVSSNGDVHASGNMYAASAVLGTSTNPGDLAERVDINPMETVEAGDVMMVDPASPDRYQKSNTAYEPTVAGVISTNPTIIVGNGKTDQTAPLAMVGRVPVKFSEENGSIQRGDLLVSASTPGYAMKYDPILDNSRKVVGIIGIALDNSLESTNGKVMTLIRTGWVYNKTQATANLEQQIYYVATSLGLDMSVDPEIMNIGTDNEGSITYNSDSNLSLNNFSITNVKSIVSTNNKWTIDEFGLLITKITTSEGDKNIYGMTSESAEITLSGSDQLINGEITITFATSTRELIDETQEIKVIPALTSGDCNGIYVSVKSAEGFTVKELNGGTSLATFDWMVIAKRKLNIQNEVNIEPTPTQPVDPPTTTPSTEPSTSTPPIEPSTSTPPTTTPLTEIQSSVEDPVSTSSPD